MANHPQEELHTVEREVIATIRKWRAELDNTVHRTLLRNPAQLMYHMILKKHGNARLRFRVIAGELGIGWRTLQRKFIAEYSKSMKKAALEVRLEYARHLLSVMEPTKMSVIADCLGYDAEQDFTRFFERRMHISPAKWSKAERAKAAAKAAQLRATNDNASS